MPPQFVAELDQVSKYFGDRCVLKDIRLSFYYGAKIGIVGDNGAGKSTLLKIMAGLDTDIHGQARLNKGMRVRYVAQEPQLDLDKTVRENLEQGLAPLHAMLDEYNQVTAKMAEDISPAEMDKLMDRMTVLQEKLDASGAWETDRLLAIVSDAMCLPPDDLKITVLSGGERRRVALAKALLEKPDLLLLDEPTNHLDAQTVAWLETQLREYPGTVIIVTHDRYFLDNITRWILELEDGKGIPFEGNYSSWLKQKQEWLRITEKKETQRQRVLARELEWISASPTARQKKSKARISAYEEMASQETQGDDGQTLIRIAPGPRLGEKVLSVRNLSKGYDYVNLLDDISFDLPRGAVVGVVGPNGVGKTTLFRMIVGQEQPDSGTLELGPTVLLSYVDQNRDELDPKKTVFEEITDGRETIVFGKQPVNSRAYLARFNFKGSLHSKLVGELSGGERNRVHLAKLLKRGGNFILLDEPTNDLDVGTMRVLEQAIQDFPGCVMVISHDRFFLDRICTHLLVLEGQGKIRWFEGNFAAFQEQLAKEGKTDPLAQRRAKYKRLALR